MSLSPAGSVAAPVAVISVPSFQTVVSDVMRGVGATSRTRTVVVPVACAPSASVTRAPTV